MCRRNFTGVPDYLSHNSFAQEREVAISLYVEVLCFSYFVLVWHMKFEDFEVLKYVFWMQSNLEPLVSFQNLLKFQISPGLLHLETDFSLCEESSESQKDVLAFSWRLRLFIEILL